MKSERIILAFAFLFLGVWAFFCQRQLNLLADKLTRPTDPSRTSIAQHEKAKAEEEAFKASISNVISQRLVARKKCTHQPQTLLGKPEPKTLSPDEYVAALQTIDTSACPKKFRLAWLDYVQTWERTAQYPPIRRIEDLVQSVGAVQAPSGLHDVDARADKRDTTEAWRQCVRVALEFDVVIPPDPAL